MVVTDAQVRRLKAEMTKSGSVGIAAARAGMSRNTATKYLKTDKLPSELGFGRDWRTRPDPFEEDWTWVKEQLAAAPGLEARTLFDELIRLRPGRYQEGQLRTLQRRLKQWRATEGPEKELHLPQEHVPGEAMQTDFTWMKALRITIAREPYEHMLCHSTLPYLQLELGNPLSIGVDGGLSQGCADGFAPARSASEVSSNRQLDRSNAFPLLGEA